MDASAMASSWSLVMGCGGASVRPSRAWALAAPPPWDRGGTQVQELGDDLTRSMGLMWLRVREISHASDALTVHSRRRIP